MLRRPCLLVIAVTWIVTFAGTAAAQDGVRRDDRPPPQPATQPTLTRPPELVEAAPPEYPPEAAAAGLEAEVTVRISVDATGAVTDVQVVTPVGHGFDEAAVAAARAYRFRPAEWDGKPGPIVVETTIHFQLEVEEVEVPVDDGGAAATQPAAGEEVVRGVVKERGTRRKLAGVTVALGDGAEAVTDAEGRFELTGVQAGTWKLVAVAAGYDRFEETVTLNPGEVTELSVYLRPRGGTPYETTVEGEPEKLEVTRRTVTRRQMTTVPGTFGDPIRVIQNLPGMNRAPYVAGFLLIRGSNPDDSGVYVDGHRVPLLYHFLGGPSVLNAEFLEDIDLYPGGFPTRFGRSLGGVVDVETRAAATDGIHGSADIDLIDSSFYLRAPVGDDVTVAFAARRSYVDAILPFVLPEPGQGETLVVVPRYWDYQARADVDLPGRDTLSFLAFGSDDRLELLASDEESVFDLDTHVGFHRVRATWKTPFSRGLTLSISPIFGYDEVSFSGGERTSLEATQTVFGMRERVHGELSKKVRIDVGLDLEYRINEYTAFAPIVEDVRSFGQLDVPSELFQRNVDTYALGLYGEVAWDVGRGVRLIPGLRVDGYFLAGEPRLTLDPRLVARWQVVPSTAVKAYVGVFHQPPQAEGLDAQFGNPELGLERAIHVGAGVERKLTKHVEVDAEVYYVDRDELAVFVQDVVTNPDGTIDPVFWANEGVGRTYGLELMVKHDVTRNFYGWISYTLARSEQKRHPDDDWTLTAFDATHNLILVASYRTDGGIELGLRMRAVTGRPETPILGGTYEADDDDYEPLTADRRSGRRPFFHQLDFRAEKTWLWKTWMLGAYLDIMNVYNAENPEATQWDYRFRESAPVRGVPFVPTIGVRGQW